MTLAHPPAQYCLTKSCLPFRYKLMTHETTGKDRDDLPNTSLPEIAWLFLKLGSIGFGGPAANTALMEQEVVTKRRWLTHEHFLDLLAAANLIPGLTSSRWPHTSAMCVPAGAASSSPAPPLFCPPF